MFAAVDGGYSTWTKWLPCSPSCGERAYKIRHRNCTNPAPQYGGKRCVGGSLETEPCAIVKCPSKWRLSLKYIKKRILKRRSFWK